MPHTRSCKTSLGLSSCFLLV
uniref:Uncharacterized protein n=1 Tax=Arundo donax TaxID=35708 RepID=A0A0A9HDR1_ARUDO